MAFFIGMNIAGYDVAAVQTEVNLAILRQFNENNLDMAFPTQTLYNLKN